MSAVPLPAQPWTQLSPEAAEPLRSPQSSAVEVETVDRVDVGERKRARRLQAEAPPLRGEDYRLRPIATGIAPLDRILVGGFPRGEQSEIHGPASSGRTGALLALLAHTTRAGALAALVDPLDRLD